MFFCKKLGHMIKDCWTWIRLTTKNQTNIATNNQKL